MPKLKFTDFPKKCLRFQHTWHSRNLDFTDIYIFYSKYSVIHAMVNIY